MVLLFLNYVILHLYDYSNVELRDILLNIVLLDVTKLTCTLLLLKMTMLVLDCDILTF